MINKYISRCFFSVVVCFSVIFGLSFSFVLYLYNFCQKKKVTKFKILPPKKKIMKIIPILLFCISQKEDESQNHEKGKGKRCVWWGYEVNTSSDECIAAINSYSHQVNTSSYDWIFLLKDDKFCSVLVCLKDYDFVTLLHVWWRFLAMEERGRWF